jgi:hypothetical protein
MPDTSGISPVFAANSTMLGISGQKSEISLTKPDRLRVTSLSLDSALTVATAGDRGWGYRAG